MAIGRLQAAQFIHAAKERIVNITGASWGAVGRCLEWDTPFYTVKGLGGLCQHRDVLVYADSAVGKQPKMDEYPHGTRLLTLDIQALPEWVPRDYNAIICFFVLEHVPEPENAMKSIAQMLLTGGFALLAAPFLDGVHACPEDYFRYTPSGLRRLAEAAGLEVLWTFSPGNPSLAAGEFIGMKSSYWSARGILEESDSHPTNVFLLARKPWRGRHWRNPPRPNRTLRGRVFW